MKEWNELLKYIDEYIYDEEEEQIVIRYSEKARKAQEEYHKALAIAGGNDKEAKWIFDIALDCVRRMSDEDKDFVKKNMNTTEYHMGYAMGIRNRYIHPTKNHSVWIADNISSCVMRRIFSIISPVYDYRNPRCVNFFESFDTERLMKLYGESHSKIIEDFVAEITSEEAMSDTDDIVRFKERLKAELGQDEFIRLFKEAYKYFVENEKQKKRDDWYWNTNFPGVKAVLYPLEAKQVRALLQLDYFWYIERGNAKSLQDCRKFIDENLGLREDYADFMARCGWEACSPYYNGTWTELSVHLLDLKYEIKTHLEKNIKTVGELCKQTRDDLMSVPGITEIDAIKIENALLEWLNERKLVR